MTKYINTKYTKDKNIVNQTLKSPLVDVDFEADGADFYEIGMKYRSVEIKRPYQFMIAVYQVAKSTFKCHWYSYV